MVVVEVEDVGALGRPVTGVGITVVTGLDGGDSSIAGAAGNCFFCPPNEKVRPAVFKNPAGEDFGMGGTGMSTGGFLRAPRHSSEPPVSADDGAVEALLWWDELSVEVVLVVFEDPLPLFIISKSLFGKTSVDPHIPIRFEVSKYVVIDRSIGSRRPMERVGCCRESRTAVKRFGPNHLGAFENAK